MNVLEPKGEFVNLVNSMMQDAFNWRGLIIDKTIFLERSIDYYIARYFSKDDKKRSELIEIILSTDRIIFGNKIQILKFLVDNHNVRFKEVHPTQHKDLTSLMELRNIWAHYLLDTSPQGVDEYMKSKAIGFIKFRNSMERVKYEPTELENYKKLLEKYITAFRFENEKD